MNTIVSFRTTYNWGDVFTSLVVVAVAKLTSCNKPLFKFCSLDFSLRKLEAALV